MLGEKSLAEEAHVQLAEFLADLGVMEEGNDAGWVPEVAECVGVGVSK